VNMADEIEIEAIEDVTYEDLPTVEPSRSW
jgi:hypothetical protein